MNVPSAQPASITSAFVLPALILIDMQQGFNDPYWGVRNHPLLETKVAALLSHWREMARPIFHVQHLSRHLSSPLHESRPGVRFMDCAIPLAHESVIQKRENSCFIGTQFESVLKKADIDQLVFVGISTDHCVSTSTRMAANLGFSCKVVFDATATFDRIDYRGVQYSADLVHAVSLASLHGEFATVVEAADL